MSLVRWFRKNNKKMMAIVVIIIMIGFVGGTYLQQLGKRSQGQDKVVALFGQDEELKAIDFANARAELELLKILRSDLLLRNLTNPRLGIQDIHAMFMAELLFADRQISPDTINQLRQIIGGYNYAISNKQINDIYETEYSKEIYWMLLAKEADRTGFLTTNEIAKTNLAEIVPMLFQNQVSYTQLIGSIIKNQGLSEDKILETYGKLLSVMDYARAISSNENVTLAQLTQTVSHESETINVDFVRLDSIIFAEDEDEPSEKMQAAQFEKYKDILAGTITKENPYGFGYKLRDSVALEYLVIKLSDVEEIVDAPTQEELEDFYKLNREQFIEQIPADPNDPNSFPTQRSKSYPEVVEDIRRNIVDNRVRIKTEALLKQAKEISEAKLLDLEEDPSALKNEDFEKVAIDYQKVAEELNKEHNIKIYHGQTGLLNGAEVQGDAYLSRLYLPGNGYFPAGLTQVAFAVEGLDITELGSFDVAKPRMFENIGPLEDVEEQIKALVRIVKIQKASAPESIEITVDKNSLDLSEETEDNSLSIKDAVIEDLKNLAAVAKTGEKAKEFIGEVEKAGFEYAAAKFNELYAADKPDDEKPFDVQELVNLRRMQNADIDTLQKRTAGDPTSDMFIQGNRIEMMLINKLYSLVPDDSNSLEATPYILEFKPTMSHYVLKKLTVNRLNEADYESIKGGQVLREDTAQTQTLAPVFFNPKNIVKRLNFRLIESDQDDEQADANDQGDAQ